MSIEAGDRVIEILDIGPTAHTGHLLVAYLPDKGLLFEADHFALLRVGPVPPAVTSTQTFAEALAREALAVKRIVSAHSPRVATPDDLRRALQAEIFQAGLWREQDDRRAGCRVRRPDRRPRRQNPSRIPARTRRAITSNAASEIPQITDL